jgi:hypothetical protein
MDFDGGDCYDILAEIGVIEKEVKEDKYGYCCGKKMDCVAEFLFCVECANSVRLREEYTDENEYHGVYRYKIGNREMTCYGSQPKTKGDRIAGLINSFKVIINRNNKYIETDLLNQVCEAMFDITSKCVKKSDNRKSLFQALLHHISIRNGNILTIRETQNIVGQSGCKYSVGNKIIVKAILDGYLDREKVSFGEEIHKQLITKYLSIYDPKFYLDDGNLEMRHINTPENRKFCFRVIKIMLEQNIAYNALMSSKCIAVIYYIVKEKYNYPDDERYQKKKFTELVGVGENTFIKVYNTLRCKDTQRLLVKHLKMIRDRK